MRSMPSDLIATGRTPLYDRHSMPAAPGLSHRTRAHTGARITALSGRLRHRSLDALARSGSLLLQSLSGAVAGVLLPRHALEQPGREYVALFHSHMDAEETRLSSLFGQHLSVDDWHDMQRMMATRNDPVFGLQVADGYERLYREIHAGRPEKPAKCAN